MLRHRTETKRSHLGSSQTWLEWRVALYERPLAQSVTRSHASPCGRRRSRWQRRFFVLRESQLVYYRAEAADLAKPRRTIELSNCVVVDEGTKKSRERTFFVFSLWVQGT